MIDPKRFMEFFEKEYGARFVDANTGKNALDLIKESRVCKKCDHVIHGDGKSLHIGDMVCGNPCSEYITDFRMSDDTCELWEAAKEETK
jgi:hypothetical protein